MSSGSTNHLMITLVSLSKSVVTTKVEQIQYFSDTRMGLMSEITWTDLFVHNCWHVAELGNEFRDCYYCAGLKLTLATSVASLHLFIVHLQLAGT